jgi:hypothetical protein
MSEVNMNYIITFTGKKVCLGGPSRDSLDIDDIAHALANIPRFNGHLDTRYSVAEHSLFVMKLVRKYTSSIRVLRAALMHDASEAYLGDMSTPLKLMCPDYRTIEKNFEEQLAIKFNYNGLPEEHLQTIKMCDFQALQIEAECYHYHLHNQERWAWADQQVPTPQPFSTAEDAGEAFLQAYDLMKL